MIRWLGSMATAHVSILAADLSEAARWESTNGPGGAGLLVHYYGSGVERLPGRLTPSGAGGWHQYGYVRDVAAAAQLVEELRGALRKAWPRLAWGDGGFDALLADARRGTRQDELRRALAEGAELHALARLFGAR